MRIPNPILLIFVLLICACQNKMKAPEGDFTIHGQVAGVDTLIFEKIEADKLFLIDTLYAVNGEFVAANSITSSSFFLLRTPDGEGINLLIKKGEHLEIEGSRAEWSKNYTVSGSKGSNLIYSLNQKLDLFEKEIDAIYDEAKNAQKEDFIAIQNRFNETFETHTSYLKNFIDNNPNSKSILLALFQSVKGENILNLQSDYDYYQKVDSIFSSKWPKSTHSKLLSEILSLAFAPNFSMENLNGDSVSLSDYKNQVVLIDFWASWCKPCRIANPKMVKLYSDFHEQGLEIISISLDGTPQQKTPRLDWEKAVEKDKLTWPQLSELKGWSSEIRNLYDLKSIPYTVLINSEGRVVAQDLDEMALRIKITELLQK